MNKLRQVSVLLTLPAVPLT